MSTNRIQIVIITLAIGVGTAVPALALARAKTTHKYIASEQEATLSTGNGYPSPGGTALLVGTLKAWPAGGRGAIVDHVTVTGHPSSTVFAFKGTEVDYLTDGTWHATFTGTDTIESDGSQQLAVLGHFVGGTGRYHGATGHYKFGGSIPAGSSIVSGASHGSISY